MVPNLADTTPKHCPREKTLIGKRKREKTRVFCGLLSLARGLVILVGVFGSPSMQGWANEPPAINPFAPRQVVREDAVPGYVELSDGTILVGNIYMTRDKRLKIYDEALKRQREIPLSAVAQIECRVLKEWMEKEYRFRETTRDEKYYTGRTYPAREYEHVITLKDGRQITGGLAELLYVEPLSQEGSMAGSGEPTRVILHKRQKGEIGQTLKQLVYVKMVKLGDEALAEGKVKLNRLPKSAGSTKKNPDHSR